MSAEAPERGRVGGEQRNQCGEGDRGDRDQEAVPHPAGQRLVEQDRAQRAESRVGGQARGVELVGGVTPDRRRHDEPERVQRRQADDYEERVSAHHSDEALAPFPWCARAVSPCPRTDSDRPIDALAPVGSHVVTIRLRTHSDKPIRTLAMPSSITATLAAVPFEPFEKLLQMYSSITLEA